MLIHTKPTLLIPAAGYGRRMGSPPAKEMLLRKGADEPLIAAPLRWAAERQWRAVVITRPEKRPLIDYLQKCDGQPELVLLEASQDWQHSLLQAEALWSDHNIIVLPDVEFSPIAALDQMATLLNNNNEVVAAQHTVVDPAQWGHVWLSSAGEIAVVEKPTGFDKYDCAWGLLGFKKSIGHQLLHTLWESQTAKKTLTVRGSLATVRLQSFVDLTREIDVLRS